MRTELWITNDPDATITVNDFGPKGDESLYLRLKSGGCTFDVNMTIDQARAVAKALTDALYELDGPAIDQFTAHTERAQLTCDNCCMGVVSIINAVGSVIFAHEADEYIYTKVSCNLANHSNLYPGLMATVNGFTSVSAYEMTHDPVTRNSYTAATETTTAVAPTCANCELPIETVMSDDDKWRGQSGSVRHVARIGEAPLTMCHNMDHNFTDYKAFATYRVGEAPSWSEAS